MDSCPYSSPALSYLSKAFDLVIMIPLDAPELKLKILFGALRVQSFVSVLSRPFCLDSVSVYANFGLIHLLCSKETNELRTSSDATCSSPMLSMVLDMKLDSDCESSATSKFCLTKLPIYSLFLSMIDLSFFSISFV